MVAKGTTHTLVRACLPLPSQKTLLLVISMPFSHFFTRLVVLIMSVMNHLNLELEAAHTRSLPHRPLHRPSNHQ